MRIMYARVAPIARLLPGGQGCLALLIALFTGACAGSRPTDLGPRADGTLKSCPGSSNCVVSLASADDEHRVMPLAFTGDSQPAKERFLALLATMPRVELVTSKDNYIHAEFTSRLWRFVDDVEFLFDQNTSTIQVRSASRLGHSDLGVNRQRLEKIRALWQAANQRP